MHTKCHQKPVRGTAALPKNRFRKHRYRADPICKHISSKSNLDQTAATTIGFGLVLVPLPEIKSTARTALTEDDAHGRQHGVISPPSTPQAVHSLIDDATPQAGFSPCPAGPSFAISNDDK